MAHATRAPPAKLNPVKVISPHRTMWATTAMATVHPSRFHGVEKKIANEAALAMLTRVKELGARVSIDDFGTGYSSLGYLLRFPADSIKIDRSFVASLGRGKRHQQVVEAVISLGRGLGMDVVAEGIETEEQRATLVSLGCPFGQGFLFSRPVDGTRIEQMLEKQSEGKA